MSQNQLTFDQAVALASTYYGDGFMQPSRTLSSRKPGQWLLRNIRGFLCFVSDGGKVWDFRTAYAPEVKQ